MSANLDPTPDRRATPTLPELLKQGAARSADIVQGASALLFMFEPGAGPQLRAAAGFATPEDAQEAASKLEEAVYDARSKPEPAQLPAPDELADKGLTQLWIAPVAFGRRVHGALAILASGTPSESQSEQLDTLLESLSLRVDHARLCAQIDELESSLDQKLRSEDQRSDEILKLSEALFAQDIELLRNNEKLGSVDKLKSDFIEKMSRELRTPLNSIIESIISVLAGENENLSELAKEALRHALDDGTTFLRTLQTILDLWRIKQGDITLEHQVVSFREVVDEAIFSVQDTLGNKPVRIEKHLREPIPKIRTDLAKVNQVLFLVLDNAAKFTDEGTIDITVEIDEGRLNCGIKDTGVGICADDQQYLFDEFYQVDDSATSRYRGAGLGLSLVRELLGLLDGEITLSSEIGVGTEVTFTVPIEALG